MLLPSFAFLTECATVTIRESDNLNGTAFTEGKYTLSTVSDKRTMKK
jgi:hypothetical protein